MREPTTTEYSPVLTAEDLQNIHYFFTQALMFPIEVRSFHLRVALRACTKALEGYNMARIEEALRGLQLPVCLFADNVPEGVTVMLPDGNVAEWVAIPVSENELIHRCGVLGIEYDENLERLERAGFYFSGRV